jgi:hypothetical protein
MTKASRDTVGSPDYFSISPKSLCEKLTTYKSCGTRTDPAAETKSIGLPADAFGWCLVFCSPPRLFYRDPKLTARHPDLVPSRQFHRDQQTARPPTGTGKKRGTPTRTPTQLNRRAVMFKHNTDGIVNCLLQPGQLRNQLHKSMLINFNSLI